MAKSKKFIAFLMATVIVGSALTALAPTAVAAPGLACWIQPTNVAVGGTVSIKGWVTGYIGTVDYSVDVSGGVEGEDWELEDLGPSGWYKFNYALYLYTAGTYTVTVTAIAGSTILTRTATVKANVGMGALEITEMFAEPGEVHPGGLALVNVHVACTLGSKCNVALGEGDLSLDLPAGWETLSIDGPGVISGGETATLVAAVSIPPGTPLGEYDIGATVPYLAPSDNHWQNLYHPSIGWYWAITNYGANWYDELFLEDLVVTASDLNLRHTVLMHSWLRDGGNVQISTDNGATWTLITPAGGYDAYVLALGEQGFTGNYYITWESFDLSAYAGMTVDIKFVFASDYFGSSQGWYLLALDLGGTNLIEDLGVPSPPGIPISVMGKMKGNELAYYRHMQNDIRELVTLDLNLEFGLDEGYGYWSQKGGYGYFFNPGKNGNGMAGLTGKEAKD